MHNPVKNMFELATVLGSSSGEDDASEDELFEELLRAVTKDFHQQIAQTVDQLDRMLEKKIEQTYSLLKRTNWKPVREYQMDLGRRKSNVEAASYRNLGDDAMSKEYHQRYTDAQAAYTTSLSFAVVGSEEEATTFAKRSELWYRRGRYESCLLDANRALKNHNCPSNLKTSLQARRAECVERIKEENIRKIGLVEKYLTDDCFATLFPSVYSGFFQPYLPDESETEPRHVDVSGTISAQSTTVSRDPRMGRMIVANRDLEAGEIISKEEYFSMVLNPRDALNHCAYCLEKCDALIPCPTCVYELYCGKNCREKAFSSYHQFECKVWPYYLYELVKTDDIAFVLAARTLLIGTEQGAALRNLMKDAKLKNLFPVELSYHAHSLDGSYTAICNEEAKAELITPEDILKSTRFILVLRELSFFVDDTHGDGDEGGAENMMETELFAAKLLLKHLTSIKSNSFVVTERLISTPFASKQKCNRIGEGTLGFNSLFNHCCDPNAADFTRRRNNFIYTLRPIKAGEQIFISYGYCYFDGTLSDRLQQSAMYGFQCFCHACANNWPKVAGLRGLPTQYLTENSDVIRDIENKSKAVWTPGSSETGKLILKPWKIMCDFCRDLNTNVSKPSLKIIKCENFIELCMRHLSNFYVESLDEVEPELEVAPSLEKASGIEKEIS